MIVDLLITVIRGLEEEPRPVKGVTVFVEPHVRDMLALDDPRLADLRGLWVQSRRVKADRLELICDGWLRTVKEETP